MKSFSKKVFVFLMLIGFVSAVFAGDYSSVPGKYQPAKFTKAVEKQIGHKSEDYEKTIIDSCYDYYYNEAEEKWDKKAWEEAVKKAAELCSNKAAIAAAKAGKFGEKFLKALAVSVGDAANSFSKWLDEKSEEYDKKNK